MIHFEEAQSLLENNAPSLEVMLVATADSLGSFLATDRYAPIDLPPFANSSIDGFALHIDDLTEKRSLKIAGTLRAHEQGERRLERGTCLRIMTGAPLPLGANVAVMKEQVSIQGDYAFFNAPLSIGQHIRERGGDCRKGTLIAKRGRKIDAPLLGLFLSMGIAQVPVFKLPSLAIIGTGDELIEAGKPLGFGQVYRSVAPMVKAQCEEFGFHHINLFHCGDDREGLEGIIEKTKSELILISGGMSQGDYDLVRPVLASLGAEEIFWQGFWRPGKPLFFGRLGTKCIFGLPGNPVASFVGFRVFVESMLLHALEAKPRIKKAKIAHDFEKKPGWSLFLRASLNDDNELFIAKNQDSHQLFTLSESNALCLIDSRSTIVKAGEEVQYYPL